MYSDDRQMIDVFFFNDTATTEIYTLSLHDALPISPRTLCGGLSCVASAYPTRRRPRPWPRPTGASAEAQRLARDPVGAGARSEEHTSELQSRQYLVCRLLLEKKNKHSFTPIHLLST